MDDVNNMFFGPLPWKHGDNLVFEVNDPFRDVAQAIPNLTTNEAFTRYIIFVLKYF